MSSQEISTKSRRITSNTLVLFLRMMAIMVINLYAVRVVLAALGEVDFGIFNAIAGVVLTSTFITITLSISIQRFYSYSIGKNEPGELRKIFSSSMNIVLVLSVVILILFETVGLWFVEAQMMEPVGKIPIERLHATLWIFQFALFTFILSLVQLPYTAAIFANEDMGIYAAISFLECVARLVVAFLIGKALTDGLVFYGAGLLVVGIVVFVTYALIGHYRYQECHYRRVRDKAIYRNILSFSGWAMYGTISGVTIIQGTTILLSAFFGPVSVACYAIANQIYNAVNSVCNSIVIAFRPAMVKSYAESEHFYLNRLFNTSNKFIAYLMICMVIPLICEMPTILLWWLGEVNVEAVLFSRLMLVMVVVLVMHNPITTIIQSTGKVRNYYLMVDTLTLMCIPISWMLFKFGMPSYWAFISMIGVCLIAHPVRLYCLKVNYPEFSCAAYFRQLVFPAAAITLLCSLFTFGLHTNIESTAIRFLAVFVLSPVFSLSMAYALGISHDEKLQLKAFVKQIIRR